MKSSLLLWRIAQTLAFRPKNEEEEEDEELVTDQEVEAFLMSVVLVTFLTIILFSIFSRVRNNQNNNRVPNTYNATNSLNNRGQTYGSGQNEQTLFPRQGELERQRRYNVDYNDSENNSMPVPPPNSNHRYLIDGIIPFRHGKANNWNSFSSLLMGKNETYQDCKERVNAAVLGTLAASKGCNVVLTIRQTDLGKGDLFKYDNDGLEKDFHGKTDTIQINPLCNALAILASQYNLFVVIHTQEEDVFQGSTSIIEHKEKREKIQNIKNKLFSIPEDLLPRHRILCATSVIGRIAIVRQLRPDLVVDFDTEIQKQLTRFGFSVHIYDDGGDGLHTLVK